MSERDEIPSAIWEGKFRLFGVEAKCYVLSDGRRIIDADDFHAIFEAMANGAEIMEGEMESFVRWQQDRA